MRSHLRVTIVGWLSAGVLLAAAALLPGSAAASSDCVLRGPSGPVSHVVYLQFDNVHFRRDNPNVPSDLEQMPHLLHFLEDGTLLTNQHTPLLSHTADDLVTSLTGLYGDRHGMPIANEYQVYGPSGATSEAGSFAYWTDPIVQYDSTPITDGNPTLVAPGGGNPPAPWTPYTRAGCSFGSVAMADTELENTDPDVAQVFGANSPEAQEAADNPDLASTDFEGLSIHCAQDDALCSSAHHGVPDVLPGQPAYQRFRALFGSKYIAPLITGGQDTVTNLDGQRITDSSGTPGFPGYDGLQPVNSLAYTLALQEHGVPVTFTYISSAHENADGTPYGPGQAEYVDQLHTYDHDFEMFFEQLAEHGITPANTLFFVGSDENDQFVGSSPVPANCDGTTVPCTYNQIGEIDANVQGLLAAKGITTPFDLHSDSAAGFYLHGQPAAADPAVRSFERATATLQADNPYTGQSDRLSQYLADPAELKLLHMVTGDPARTPTFVSFLNPFYWAVQNGPDCGGSCSSIDSGEGWNHGDVQPQITNTWAGMVGPGVRSLGATGQIWSDHADIQPTLMALLGLRDDYVPEGRVLTGLMQPSTLPHSVRGDTYSRLADVYKQIEAPVGLLGRLTLDASTRALASDSPGDATYRLIESRLTAIDQQRDQIGTQMIDLLDGAAFDGRRIDQSDARRLELQGRALLAEAWLLARS